MNYGKKLDDLEKANEAARREITGEESSDARFDAYMEALKIAARVLALNEWRLATKGAEDLDALRREEREEFPGENASMDAAAWLEAILGAWGAGGFLEARKTAPPEKEERSRVASAFARFAPESILAASLAWYLEPSEARLGLYVSSLLKHGGSIKGASLLWAADSFANADLRGRADSAAESDLRRFRDESIFAGREEADLWARVTPDIGEARLNRIEFTVSLLALIRWNKFYIEELKADRLFPLWLEMAPSRFLSLLERPLDGRKRSGLARP